ncbi:MAG: MarR family winged helix-turn-helix transcriptional regulator [Salaquimonas sp.]
MADDKNNQMPLYFQFFNEIGIIEQLSRAMMEARLPDGFLMTHFTVLNHLIRVGDGRTPLAIATAFQVPKTSMTHTLAGLEKAGLVEMKPNPKDGRSKQVWLTEKGQQFRLNAITHLRGDFTEFQEKFPPDKIGPMLPLLAEIRAYLDKLRDPD